MEVVQTSEEQALVLVQELLQENPELEEYDPYVKTFTKSKSTQIASYLAKAIKQLEEFAD